MDAHSLSIATQAIAPDQSLAVNTIPGGLSATRMSTHSRQGWSLVLSELVATFALLSVLWGSPRLRSGGAPLAVAGYIPIQKRSFGVATRQLLRGAEKDRTHHGLNRGCHLLGGDTVRGLKPTARSSKNSPGRGGRPQRRIGAGCEPMMGKAVFEHALDHRDDGAYKRHPSQLTGTAWGLSKIIAHAECNGAQRTIAFGNGDTAALDQVAEAEFCHSLQQCIFVRIVQVKGGPV